MLTLFDIARELDISEEYILGLVKDGLIDFFTIEKTFIYNWYRGWMSPEHPANYVIGHCLNYRQLREAWREGALKLKIFCFDDDALESIDWWIRDGKKKNRGIRKMARESEILKQQVREKMNNIKVFY